MSEPPEAPAAAAGNKIPEGDGVAARKMPGNSPNSGSSSSSSPSRRRIPLKTILQNFLNHVDALEAEKHDSECSNGGSLYEKEFQQLKAFSDSLKLQSDFSCKEGELEVNRKKNRSVRLTEHRLICPHLNGVLGTRISCRSTAVA